MEKPEFYIIKNLTIVDVEVVYTLAIKDTNEFIIGCDITQKDIERLQKHFFYSRILKIYSEKTNYNFLIFLAEGTKITEEKNFIKSFRYLKNKIKFPTLVSNISLKDYLNLLNQPSPEYDEAINQNFSLADKLSLLKTYMKTSGLSTIYNKINSDTTKLLGFK